MEINTENVDESMLPLLCLCSAYALILSCFCPASHSLCLRSATSSRRVPSASGRSSSRGRSDVPVELQQMRDGLEDELRLLKRQYNEIASHLSQVLIVDGAHLSALLNSNWNSVRFLSELWCACRLAAAGRSRAAALCLTPLRCHWR